jgi:hypothetical protein
MISVIIRNNITHRTIHKPKREVTINFMWTRKLGLETSQSVYAV